MFDPAVGAILDHHESRSGHSLMRATAQRAQELGYALVPPARGEGKYLRLMLTPPHGTAVTLYLDGNRITAGAKKLRRFAAGLPGAVVADHDVRFPLGTVEISVLEAALAHSGGTSELPSASLGEPQRSSPPDAAQAAAPAARPSPPQEAPAPSIVSGGVAPATHGNGHSSRYLLGAVAALLLLVAVLLVGPGGTLVLGGLAVTGTGVAAVLSGRLGWARIASRGVGGAVVAGGVALFVVGGLLLPTSPDPQSDRTATGDVEDEARAPSEPAIAAAEATLAQTETQERALAPDALVAGPASGALSDGAALAVVEAAPRTSALAALAAVETKGRAPRTGYDRDLFGSGWGDPDRNGCDTRNDVLARDLTAEVFKPGTRNCVVLTGALVDPYSGRAIAFQRG
ncbi:MAG: hypothetical protein ACLGI3_10745, partial [Actinomycetes bacterium]